MIKAGEQLRYNPLTGTTWWKIQLKGSYVGTSKVYETSGTDTILDTGTSLIAMPTLDFRAAVKVWQNAYSKLQTDASGSILLFKGSCSSEYSTFDPLYFKFGDGNFYSVPSSSYLLNGSELGLPGYCVIGVQAISQNMYILGDVFLRNYYQVYDF